MTIIVAVLDASVGSFNPKDLYVGAFFLDLFLLLALSK